ncbi:hypothetical protein FisN_14Hh237 [Fistulifera solaris]|uniref:Tyrosine specific protein phosphatases domain-containing protein n=1 Tax=Fistulifera solaris TaxID=1519565 RepID=A0A1Z5K8N9_FISSO|nr:hypothetical protein FisN_14Hh237 [Fistulifera solaris]|eukprot:GAX22604.1 hypothetical protein FisN_14Hh237 [Fistulifera solaris]
MVPASSYSARKRLCSLLALLLSGKSCSWNFHRDMRTTTQLFTQSVLKPDEPMLDDSDQTTFLQHCKALCEERNLPLQKVKNARDLASVRNSPIQPGRIFRMGRVSDATEEDIQLLFQKVGFKTLVDLRSPTELKDDPTLMREDVFKEFTNVVWQERGRGKEGCLRELKVGEGPVRSRNVFKRLMQDRKTAVNTPREVVDAVLSDDPARLEQALTVDAEDDGDCGYETTDCAQDDAETMVYDAGQNRKERHFVSLMNEFKYVKGTLSRVRKRDITKSILKSPGAILSRRVRSSAKKPFLDEINGGGLQMLNELLLRYANPGIRHVLELCADRNRHPIAFYCTAGKDRTGIIAAIILALCGVKSEDIVEDYTLSANVYAEMNDHQAMVGALSQRNLDAKTFLGAPPAVMRDILVAIETEYGSVEGYCDWIGFGPEMREKLRDAVLKE